MTISPHADYFADLRRHEFGRLDAHDSAYLDYTGSALYGASQLRAYADLLADGVFGNPHSEHAASRGSTSLIESARRATLAWFDVDESSHAVCFVANASAAIKLVAESYPFAPARGLLLSADNHNSVNGVREYACRAGAPVTVLPIDAELRLHEPVARLGDAARDGGGLFAFPAQSNFSGVKHPLQLVSRARELGFDVLLDAAAYAPTNRLSLRDCQAQFSVLSFYKMFGLPTGVGALIARRDALAMLRRPWFSGGTVDYASVQHSRHQLRTGTAGFEDGTANFLGIAAVCSGIDFLHDIGATRLGTHLRALTDAFVVALGDLRHTNGAALVKTYGCRADDERGATVAFNVLRRDGRCVPYAEVEARALDAGVALRGGCFCNPGAAEAAFGFDAAATARCFDRLRGEFSVAGFADCVGPATGVGALRASFGAPTHARDLSRAIEVIASFAETAACVGNG